MMRAVQIGRYGEKLLVKNIDIPKLETPEQLLIKINYAPINPSDVFYVKGVYGIRKPLPTIGGFEGCGIIEQAIDKSLIGKPVLCWADDKVNSGTWADYFVAESKNTVILDKQVPDFWKYSSPFINPVTAIGFSYIAKDLKAQGAVLNAAGSAVGRMAIKLLNSAKIHTVAIVRREEQIKELQEIGATVVLNSQSPTFAVSLVNALRDQKAKVFFDALGGEHSGLIFKYLENKGQLIGYGRLANNKIADIDPIDLVFKEKQIKGFWLTKWLESQSEQGYKNVKEQIKQEIITNLATHVQSVTVPTSENINELAVSALTRTSAGKFVLDFSK